MSLSLRLILAFSYEHLRRFLDYPKGQSMMSRRFSSVYLVIHYIPKLFLFPKMLSKSRLKGLKLRMPPLMSPEIYPFVKMYHRHLYLLHNSKLYFWPFERLFDLMTNGYRYSSILRIEQCFVHSLNTLFNPDFGSKPNINFRGHESLHAP